MRVKNIIISKLLNIRLNIKKKSKKKQAAIDVFLPSEINTFFSMRYLSVP